MRHIIMIQDLHLHTLDDIQHAFQHAHIQYEIQKERDIIIVDGTNDQLRYAKQILQDLGYDVL